MNCGNKMWLTDQGLTAIRAMAGLPRSTQRSIAERLDISERTLRHWTRRHPTIKAAIDAGRRDLRSGRPTALCIIQRQGNGKLLSFTSPKRKPLT